MKGRKIFYCTELSEGKRKRVSIPFSNSRLLLISERVLPERQHHELGAVNEHHGAAILWVHADNGDMHVLHETVLQKQRMKQLCYICAFGQGQKAQTHSQELKYIFLFLILHTLSSGSSK